MEDQINILLAKIVSGNALPQEIEEFEKWKNSDVNNNNLFKGGQKAWENSKHYLPEPIVQEDKIYLIEKYSTYLSNKTKRIQKQSLIYKMVAILSIPIALSLSWYLIERNNINTADAGQICEVIAPKGHISKVILPDGTDVWINTGSSITYDAALFSKNSREVQLTGEAYFEVENIENRPFTVKTPHVDIAVTGTSFNVNTYSESSDFETVLSEGRIQLYFKNQETNTFEVEPNQRVLFNASTKNVEIQHVDSRLYNSWRKGEIIFNDATLNDLVKELGRIYDLRFSMQPSNLGELRFRGMFSYNSNLIEALEKIKLTSGIDYYIENKKVTLRKSN